ncbi:nicotinamide mononucleotide transporter family protein [Psychrobacter sp. WY6]|uniref:nicotinamide mononucleotide transporter n=1 Tax=Psychrobacter sp. WY6 TaxID=2708350 RepID=UPI002022D6DB|nr:nicotinamide mononucleotide transporter family protein [Psychrobacter sp. WY6]
MSYSPSRTNILVFPIGLVSTAIFVYLLWKWQLFGDMFINTYYTVMSLYGWINWTQSKKNTAIKNSKIISTLLVSSKMSR